MTEPRIPADVCAGVFDWHNGEHPRTYVVRLGARLTEYVLCDGCRDELRETFEVAERIDPVPAYKLFPSRRRVERRVSL